MEWILLIAASACAFMVGVNYGRRDIYIAIESTINYMIDNGYVKSKSNGVETELIPLKRT